MASFKKLNNQNIGITSYTAKKTFVFAEGELADNGIYTYIGDNFIPSITPAPTPQPTTPQPTTPEPSTPEPSTPTPTPELSLIHISEPTRPY